MRLMFLRALVVTPRPTAPRHPSGARPIPRSWCHSGLGGVKRVDNLQGLGKVSCIRHIRRRLCSLW